jgi:hypothetical protein
MMVVPLIILGTTTKLAFATAVSYRTRAWWLPGLVAIGVGTAAAAAMVDDFQTAGFASIVLGAASIACARWLRRSTRTALGA